MAMCNLTIKTQFKNVSKTKKFVKYLLLEKFVLMGKAIECMAFEKRDNRAIPKTNIYLKNLPDLSENEIKA